MSHPAGFALIAILLGANTCAFAQDSKPSSPMSTLLGANTCVFNKNSKPSSAIATILEMTPLSTRPIDEPNPQLIRSIRSKLPSLSSQMPIEDVLKELGLEGKHARAVFGSAAMCISKYDIDLSFEVVLQSRYDFATNRALLVSAQLAKR